MSGLSRLAALVLSVNRVVYKYLLVAFAGMRATKARAQGLVEYALILVLVAIVVIGILSALGGRTSRVFDQVNCSLSGGTYHQDNGNGNSNRCR